MSLHEIQDLMSPFVNCGLVLVRIDVMHTINNAHVQSNRLMIIILQQTDGDDVVSIRSDDFLREHNC